MDSAISLLGIGILLESLLSFRSTNSKLKKVYRTCFAGSSIVALPQFCSIGSLYSGGDEVMIAVIDYKAGNLD